MHDRPRPGPRNPRQAGQRQLQQSQNFLKSSKLVEKLVEQSSLGSEDIVVEIGPGEGIITEQLARHGKRVIAIEKDPRLYHKLQNKFAQNSKIELYLADILDFELSTFPYKVFSNIPFNLTADIVRKLVEAEAPPADSYLIVQRAAAERFIGLPYGEKETQFSLLIKPFFDLSVIHEFRRTDFSPVPKVDIVLLRIYRRSEPLITHEQAQLYADFVVYAFTRWKPTVQEAFEDIFTNAQFARLSRELTFNPMAKPSELQFEAWLGLFKYFLVGVADKKRRLVIGSQQRQRQQQARIQKIHRTRVAKDWRKAR